MAEVLTMDVIPIEAEQDYLRTLKEIEGWRQRSGIPRKGTALTCWRLTYPLDDLDPVAAIHYQMEQHGLAVKDLVPFVGSHSRVYEVLNRKRRLSLKMIWKLHKGLGIPVESLIRASDDTAAM